MLIGLRRVRDAYIGEIISDILINVLKDFDIIENLRVFRADNDNTNNKAVRLVLQELHPYIKNPT